MSVCAKVLMLCMSGTLPRFNLNPHGQLPNHHFALPQPEMASTFARFCSLPQLECGIFVEMSKRTNEITLYTLLVSARYLA